MTKKKANKYVKVFEETIIDSITIASFLTYIN